MIESRYTVYKLVEKGEDNSQYSLEVIQKGSDYYKLASLGDVNHTEVYEFDTEEEAESFINSRLDARPHDIYTVLKTYKKPND